MAYACRGGTGRGTVRASRMGAPWRPAVSVTSAARPGALGAALDKERSAADVVACASAWKTLRRGARPVGRRAERRRRRVRAAGPVCRRGARRAISRPARHARRRDPAPHRQRVGGVRGPTRSERARGDRGLRAAAACGRRRVVPAVPAAAGAPRRAHGWWRAARRRARRSAQRRPWSCADDRGHFGPATGRARAYDVALPVALLACRGRAAAPTPCPRTRPAMRPSP